MANTTTLFDEMLKQYAPNELFREEMLKMDWFLSNIERDDSWIGGESGAELLVPFKGASASSVQAGALVDEADISSSQYVKGKIATQPEIWGALVFNEKDLMRHGKINEQNFLKLLPQELDDFMGYMKMAVSLSFTNGPKLAKVTDSTNAATGIFIVDRIERFEIGMKLTIDDDNSGSLAAYVIAIDINSNQLTLSDSRGGNAFNFSAYTADQNACFYLPGLETSANQFSSLKSTLLSLANGGSAQLYGQSKLAYPYLQSINVSGSTMTATNILDKIFAAQTVVRQKGRGNPDTILMSWKHFGEVLAALQIEKGAFRQASDMKANEFGWSEVIVSGVKGQLKIVGIHELDDDFMPIIDKKAFKIYSNGFFRKRTGPEGLSYHTIRATTGYKYIVDIAFFGDMVLERPSRCGIIYGIST